ncbi:GntR family transcriptional regulator [Senegalia massiliensis]|uniref:GntR family transcriptional regulator n=1 Tax=Senegalia massiliensis TaxID=1720316 RepID=A0A845R0D6_9CLOT|nr:GntR family transcriptional regulator [Senegalia massiliensis]NBI07196.1 GntR family transcriptional regulator [Senegalia massiliensis]
MELELIENKNGLSVGEYVYEMLKKNIINLNIKPGERISEKEISTIFEVSRTPVREAFIKLSREGVLYILPQRGTYISLIDLEQVEEARFIRESLETAVLKIATKSFPDDAMRELEENLQIEKELIKNKDYGKFLEFDEEFHKIIFKACNKERTWDIIEQVNTQYKRVRLLSFIADENWYKVIEQHEKLLKAIREKDNENAQKTINVHLKKLLKEQEQLKELFPQYFK